MKRILLPAVLAIISLYGCQEIMTPEQIPSDPAVPLEISMSTAELTKGLIKDTKLPDGSSVGITIKDDYGVYTGELFTNVKYTAEQESGNQIWSSDSPVMLSSETGTVYAYYPYAEACTDITAISIRANSTVQTDFMWGIPVSVSKDNRKATLVMKHALAAVRITYVRGTYSGAGNVSKVSFGGNCIAVAGTLDATDGSISNLAGKGTMLTPPQIATTLSSTLQEFELFFYKNTL